MISALQSFSGNIIVKLVEENIKNENILALTFAKI